MAPALPQLTSLFMRREALGWVPEVRYVPLLLPVLPYLAALAFAAVAQRRGNGDRAETPLRLALSSAIVFNVFLLGGLHLAGVNLLHWRYLQGILVPTIFLAVDALDRSRGPRLVAASAWAAVFLALALFHVKTRAGSFMGLGVEGWREAVSVLRQELVADTATPVLFRSGFVEEDRVPLGSPVPATRAPLRSPGQEAPPWKIIPLTYRWVGTEREEYFSDVIIPVLRDAHEFYVLSRSPVYPEALGDWVERVWPGRFDSSVRDFGSVRLVHFREN